MRAGLFRTVRNIVQYRRRAALTYQSRPPVPSDIAEILALSDLGDEPSSTPMHVSLTDALAA